jgi:O-antigen/teichoic acid export membrane protein
MDALFSKIVVLSAVAGLPLTVVLSIFFGAEGAAVASVVTAGSMLTAMFFVLHARRVRIWEKPDQHSLATVNNAHTEVTRI